MSEGKGWWNVRFYFDGGRLVREETYAPPDVVESLLARMTEAEVRRLLEAPPNG